MYITPFSDSNDYYPEVERAVREGGPTLPVKNSRMNATLETALDVADSQAGSMSLRYTHEHVFGSVRKMLLQGEAQAL